VDSSLVVGLVFVVVVKQSACNTPCGSIALPWRGSSCPDGRLHGVNCRFPARLAGVEICGVKCTVGLRSWIEASSWWWVRGQTAKSH